MTKMKARKGTARDPKMPGILNDEIALVRNLPFPQRDVRKTRFATASIRIRSIDEEIYRNY